MRKRPPSGRKRLDLKADISRDYLVEKMTLEQIAKKYGYADVSGPWRLLNRMGVRMRQNTGNPVATIALINDRAAGLTWKEVAKLHGFANAACAYQRVRKYRARLAAAGSPPS